MQAEDQDRLNLEADLLQQQQKTTLGAAPVI